MPDGVRLLLAATLGAAIALLAQYFLFGSSSATSFTSSESVAVNERAGSYGATSEQQVRLANLELEQKRLAEALDGLRISEAAGAADLGSTEPVPASTAQASAATAVDSGVASVQKLTAAGVNPVDAQAMIERLDELALARLEADYRVRRDTGTGEAARQARVDRRAIPRDSEIIREEFGDEAYDQYLYSLNQPNRVQVSSVLGESSAQSAGVQQGDVLRSFDGEPLFSVRDLTRQISEGDVERSYSLMVERNGEVIETWVPGGPLGVRVNGAVAQPDG